MTDALRNLYFSTFNKLPDTIEAITGSGSNRKYFRLSDKENSVIGVYNEDTRENDAFIYLSNHFLKTELPVAKVLAENLVKNIYLIEDLGDIALFDLVSKREDKDKFTDEILSLYKKSLDRLIEFQIKGAKNLDTSYCYPRKSFDRQSIMWDLNYFKYYFAKLVHVNFDEQKLEDDFEKFADLLLETKTDFFMYRDFQSRNIMIKNDNPYFIDFQGGRLGALQYDLASILYQAKAQIPQDIREDLLSYYMSNAKKYISIDENQFTKVYNAYVLIRLLQVLGAYGYRGYYEKKLYFKQSIPPAIKNLRSHISKCDFLESMPELKKSIEEIINNSILQEKEETGKLLVSISSFSYKNGIPEDNSGNGGGFVFDCRSLANPGRYVEYKKSTGMDQDVIDFFADKTDMANFLNHVYSIIDNAVETYSGRGFTNLMVNFGCTGGQHRSVFSAENLTRHLLEKFDVSINVNHQEQNVSKSF